MHLEKIINAPKFRLNQIIETLKSEFGIEIDFADKANLAKLQQMAEEAAKTVKANESFNSQHRNPKVVCSYLILEAIKLQDAAEIKETDMKKPMTKKTPVKEGNEIDKAELLLASKNIVDDLQGMIEDLSKMQVQKLPPIIDRIKVEYGLGQAANYREQSMGALQTIMDSLNNAKDSIDNLTMSLSGDVDMAQMPEEPMAGNPPAQEPDEMMDKMDKAELPVEPSASNPEGRERKEESKKTSKPALREDLELAAKTVHKLVKHDKMDFNTALNKVKKSIVGKAEDVNAVSKRAKNLLGESAGKKAFKVMVNHADRKDPKGTATSTYTIKDVRDAEHAKSIVKDKHLPKLKNGKIARATEIKEGEEAGQNMGEKLPPELKAWHVQVKSPATNKLFGNFKVWSPTPDIAKTTAQNAVMAKHGMDEWNDEYEFTIKEIKEAAPAQPVNKDEIIDLLHDMFVASDRGDGGAGEDAHSQLRVLMHKLYPDVHVEPEMMQHEEGMEENASCGATGAGAVASIPQSLFKKKKVLKRTMESEKELKESTPPGMEEWVTKNKQRFIDTYGKKKGMETLYRTAWAHYEKNNAKKESVSESHNQEDMATLQDIAKQLLRQDQETFNDIMRNTLGYTGEENGMDDFDNVIIGLEMVPQDVIDDLKSRLGMTEAMVDEAGKKPQKKEEIYYYLSVFHKGWPGGPEDKKVEKIAQKCGIKSDGAGTDLSSGQRDVGFGNIPQSRIALIKKTFKKYGFAATAYAQPQIYESAELLEAWKNKMHTKPSEKGKWAGWTQAELKHKLSTLKNKKEHSAEDTKTIKQVEFALRSKHGWGKVKETVAESNKYLVWISSAKEASKQVSRLVDAKDAESAKLRIMKKFPKAVIRGCELAQGIEEDSNSAQTLSGQKIPQATMWDAPSAQTNLPSVQSHKPIPLAQGQKMMQGGKKVTVDADHGTMVGIKDTDTGPVRMVPKTSLEQLDKSVSGIDNSKPVTDKGEVMGGTEVGESIYEGHKMDPKQRAHRINRRSLKKYDHKDFIDLVHANLGREHAEVAEECLHGCDYSDHHPDHLHAIANFAKKKGEHNIAYDIKTHFLPEVGAPTPTGHAPVHPDQAAVISGPPTNLSSFESANKPYKLVVETSSGKKGRKSFTNEASAKKWLAANGHHLKNVKVDV